MKRYMPPPPSPAPRSPFEWGLTERIRELLGNVFLLGFERARPTTGSRVLMRPGIPFQRVTGLRERWRSLDPERREALRNDFMAFHAGFPTELGICVPREYCLTLGVRA